MAGITYVRLLLALLICAPAGAQPSPPASGTPSIPGEAQLEQIIRRAIDAWNVPGLAVTVTQGDRVIMARGFGVRSLQTGAPVDEHTSFYTASLTKSFTAAAIQILVSEGRLDPDAAVSSYLPAFAQSTSGRLEQLTLADLMAHRTGLPRADLLWFGGLTPEQMLGRLGGIEPVAPIRSRFTYQNQMYLALGEIVGRTSGMGWQTFVETRVLRPIGMRDSNAAGLGRPPGRNFAVPHGIIGEQVVPLGYIPRAPYGGGGVNTTAADMGRWLRFQLGDGTVGANRLMSATAFAEMHRPQTIIFPIPTAPGANFVTYGRGWFVHDYSGSLVWQHAGNGEGWTSLAWLMPEQRLGISILTNMNSSFVPWAIAFSIADAYRGGARRDWIGSLRAAERQRDAEIARRNQPVASVPLDHTIWRGLWRSPVYGDLEISAAGSAARLRYGPQLSARLEGVDMHNARLIWERDDLMALLGVSRARISLDSGSPVLSLLIGGDALEFRRAR